MNTILTPDEGLLVEQLLRLWDACWDEGPCRRGCDCARCEAYQQAGEGEFKVFESLREKAKLSQLAKGAS